MWRTMAFSYLVDIRGMMFSCFLLAAQSRCVDALPRECLLPLPLLRGLHYFLQCLVDVVVCQPMCDWCITCQKNSTAVILHHHVWLGRISSTCIGIMYTYIYTCINANCMYTCTMYNLGHSPFNRCLKKQRGTCYRQCVWSNYWTAVKDCHDHVKHNFITNEVLMIPPPVSALPPGSGPDTVHTLLILPSITPTIPYSRELKLQRSV